MRKAIVLACSFILAGCMLVGCRHEHVWSDATCTEPKTCTECGDTEGEALGHNWEEATCEKAKTCTVCAETEGEPSAHSTEFGPCDMCEDFINSETVAEMYICMQRATKDQQRMADYIFTADMTSLTDVHFTVNDAMDMYLEDIMANFQKAYDACGDYEELAEIKDALHEVIVNRPYAPASATRDQCVGSLESCRDFVLELEDLQYAVQDSADFIAQALAEENVEIE